MVVVQTVMCLRTASTSKVSRVPDITTSPRSMTAKSSARCQGIVNGQIAAALKGQFGDVQFTSRTKGSELFVNPLMGVYFSVDLDALARSVHYLPALEHTRTAFDVALAIEDYRDANDERRPRRVLPH